MRQALRGCILNLCFPGRPEPQPVLVSGIVQLPNNFVVWSTPVPNSDSRVSAHCRKPSRRTAEHRWYWAKPIEDDRPTPASDAEASDEPHHCGWLIAAAVSQKCIMPRDGPPSCSRHAADAYEAPRQRREGVLLRAVSPDASALAFRLSVLS
jgi:hypothetical protein